MTHRCAFCDRPHLDPDADLCEPCERCLWPDPQDRE